MTDRTAPAREVSRRGVLRGSVLAGLAASLAGAGAAGAGATYAATAATRYRAFAAQREPRMPTSARVLWRAATDERVCALTFDDGPDPRLTRPLLDALAEADVRATFFVCGLQAARHPDLVRRAVAEGHEVGNHTWGHADLSALDRDDARSELARTSDVVERLAGSAPRVLRPPWGRLSGSALHVAAEQGLDVVLWDVRLLDAERDVPGNEAHVLGHLGEGTVVLGHDAGEATRAVGLAAVPGIVRAARARGYRFVTASEMLALDGTPARPRGAAGATA